MPDIIYPKREEIATGGFDPFRQLNPDGFGMPASSGLLVPRLSGVTYLLLLAVADLSAGDCLIGLRQYLDLVSYIFTGGSDPPTPPIYPLRQPIPEGFPMWHFIDGGDTWTLTREPKIATQRTQGPLDQDSFVLRDSDSSAVVYEMPGTGFPGLPLIPGYPGLNAYAAPVMKGTKVLSVRDRRWPWTHQSNERLCFPCESDERFRFYVEVTQSNPSTRVQPSLTTAQGYQLPPPEGFLQQTYASSAVYGWAAGAMIIQRGRSSCDACVSG